MNQKRPNRPHLGIGIVLAIFVLTIWGFISYANISPKVDKNISFSSTDPNMQSEQHISKLFLRKDSQLIISAKGKIKSKLYLQRMAHLSNTLQAMPEVVSLKSITHGPLDFRHAVTSPLWKRLLVANDFLSTNIIMFVEADSSGEFISKIETVIDKYAQKGFELHMSGIPYVVELIRRNLGRDFKLFTLLAFLIFGLVMFVSFRSIWILLGTWVACTCAFLWTFLLITAFKVSMGLLTANLVTIIIVITLSHIIFMTSNWRSLNRASQRSSNVWEGVKMTLKPAFWSMLTTFLGFLSLLSVPAKPLRELGIAGAIGTVTAFLAAFVIFPFFLKFVQPRENLSEDKGLEKHIFKFFQRKECYVGSVLVTFTLVMLPGLSFINTDPSILSFFSPNEEINKGLRYIDRNGGSSPLLLVVRDKSGDVLVTKQSYEKLWNLQKALEFHPSVGSVMSLPVLMAEAKKPLTFFLTWQWLLRKLEEPQFGRIARSFITQDHRHGLFLLRMNEMNRVDKRLEVVERLKEIISAHGFILYEIGGLYYLQGQLSQMVASSLIFGLLKLLMFFFLIALVISRSLPITVAMMVSLFLIPIAILGFIGMYRIPLDIISSPASNVAMAMGVDVMIHLIVAYRRRLKEERPSEALSGACLELKKPVFTAMTVVMLGFAIFLFSAFPPTQRFGITIVLGTCVASFAALYLLPRLIQAWWRRTSFLD